MNMCNITFIVSSFGIFQILNVFKQLEKMCIGEMTVLEVSILFSALTHIIHNPTFAP